MQQPFVRAIRFFLPIVAAAFLLGHVEMAQALPRAGAKVHGVSLEDPDGRVLRLSWPRAKPTLILYEDKSSSTQNAALKDELYRLGEQDAAARAALQFAAIADVSDYNGWPLKGLAARAVRKMSKETGQPIYCDWEGAVRRAYGLRRGASSVVLVGRDGRVRFAAEGALDSAARGRLFDVLRAELHR